MSDSFYISRCLEKINHGISGFDQLILLDVNIENFSDTITDVDYMLLRVDKEIRDVLNDLWIEEKFISKAKYIFATKHNAGFEFGGRVVAYLNNRFGNSLYISDMGLIGIDILRMEIVPINWTDFSFETGDTLNITLESFRDCLAISKYTQKPSRDDIDVKFIFEEFKEFDKKHLFRGVDKFYSENNGIASSIYHKNKEKIMEGKLQEYEEGIIDKFSRYGVYKNIVTLAELRHSKQDTSLIDFTKDPMIALFFACQKTDNVKAMGEMIYFDKKVLSEEKDVKYPVHEDFVISSPGGPISQERIKVQKSVFVYAHQGYLPRDKYQRKFQHLLIDPSLKDLFFEECGFKDFDIYPDVLGFTDNTKNFEIPTRFLTPYARIEDCLGNMLSESTNGYDFFYLLDVNVNNYTTSVIKEDYMLLRIDRKIRHLISSSFCRKVPDIDRIIINSEYALAVNVFNHEQKRYFDNNFKKSISFTWSFVDGDCTKQSKHTTTIDITLEEIENMVGRR